MDDIGSYHEAVAPHVDWHPPWLFQLRVTPFLPTSRKTQLREHVLKGCDWTSDYKLKKVFEITSDAK